MLFSQSVSSASINRFWRMVRGSLMDSMDSFSLAVPFQIPTRSVLGTISDTAMSKIFVILLALSSVAIAQTKPAHKKYPIGGSYPTGANVKVAPDLDQRLAKFKAVRMPFRKASLS